MATTSASIKGLHADRRWSFNSTTKQWVLTSDTTRAMDVHRVTDAKTDRVRARKPSGWMKPKSYVRTVDSETCVTGSHQYTRGTTRVWRGGSFAEMIGQGWHQDATTVPGQDMVSRAETRALLKLKDQKFNLAQAWGERRQTAQLVGDTAFRLARAYSALRKGNFREVARQLKTSMPRRFRSRQAEQRWLELQYGWVPLLSDVHGAAEKLASFADIDWLVTVKGIQRQNYEWSVLNASSSNEFSTRRDTKGWKGVFVRLDYTPGNFFLQHLSSLGLSNPAHLAWELLPFSFVIDWLVPVGDWLSTMDAANGFDFLSGSQTRKVEMNMKTVSTLPRASYVETWNASGSRRFKTVQRSVYTSSPIPFYPRLKNPFSLTHMANGLSLLSLAFGDTRRVLRFGKG